MGNSHKNHLVWNQQLIQNQTLMEQSLDGPFPKLCLAVTLSNQDGCHSVIALLLKAALIQVCDYRLLGASGFIVYLLQHFICIFVNSCYISQSLFQMLLWETRECSWYCNQAVGHTPGTREMASICPYRIKTNRRLWYY